MKKKKRESDKAFNEFWRKVERDNKAGLGVCAIVTVDDLKKWSLTVWREARRTQFHEFCAMT